MIAITKRDDIPLSPEVIELPPQYGTRVAKGIWKILNERPACVDHESWRRAIEDGRLFIFHWGFRADALGWTTDDIFGLPDVPEQPHPSYQRLARVDQLGLAWLLRGRQVTALTTDTAAIGTPGGGTLTFYRRPVTRNARR